MAVQSSSLPPKPTESCVRSITYLDSSICVCIFILLTDVEMVVALRLLPLLLSEAPLPVTRAGKRKRNCWRPTLVETLRYFVDVVEVVFCYVCYESQKGIVMNMIDVCSLFHS